MSVIYLIIVIATKVLEILLYWYILHVANIAHIRLSLYQRYNEQYLVYNRFQTGGKISLLDEKFYACH